MEGNTHQDNYTGKNLANFTNDKNANRSSFNYISETPENITCIKTQTGGKFFARFEANLKANQEYTISWSEKSNYASWIFIYKNELWGTNDGQINVSGSKYTPNEDGTYVFGVYADNVPENYELFIKKFQIELSSTATDYEPYVGGTPSPNPDYPQDVRVVENKQVVNVSGKNLFNPSNVILNTEIQNSVVKYSSVSNIYYMKVNIGTKYNFSKKSSAKSGIIGFADEIPNTGVTTYDRTGLSGIASVSKTATHKYLILQLQKDEDLSETMVEVGNTKTTYEPYHNQDYEIDLHGKNLFDSSLITSITPSIKYIPIQCKSNTDYTLSTNNVASPTNTNLFLSTINSGVNSANNGTYLNSPRTINSGNNTTIYVGYRNDISDSWVQLEENSTATDYEEFYDYELCKIDTYKDSIKKSTGKNLFDKSAITTSTYLKEDGTLQTGTGAEYVTSDFIPVKPNTTYYKTLTLSPRTKFYDKNKQVLDNTTYQDVSIGGNAGSFTTPSNAYYFRFTGNVNTSTGININTTMVNEGSNLIPYEPYGEQ